MKDNMRLAFIEKLFTNREIKDLRANKILALQGYVV
jgi:hypothetical protein